MPELFRTRCVALFAFVALTFVAGSFHGHDEIGEGLGSAVECVACQAVSLAPTEAVPSRLTPFFATVRLSKASVGRIPRAAATPDNALPRGPPQG